MAKVVGTEHEMFLFLFQIFISCTAYLHFLQEFAILHSRTLLSGEWRPGQETMNKVIGFSHQV